MKYFVKAAYTYYDLVTDIFVLRNFCEKTVRINRDAPDLDAQKLSLKSWAS